MPRYVVEVSQPEKIAAERIDRSVRTIGSHFATHADWHLKDGVCTGTMIVEASDARGALGIVPPAMRAGAHVFRLESVTAAVGLTAAPAYAGQPYAIAA
jgi:hypothetical protein